MARRIGEDHPVEWPAARRRGARAESLVVDERPLHARVVEQEPEVVHPVVQNGAHASKCGVQRVRISAYRVAKQRRQTHRASPRSR
ncbi:MAG: hypothetical protein H0W30_11850 [Gemmatimonadaceae bacterium]|nr:hypothetical protein [Gemmatimonadaceae bacterium]MDQ3520486.1 hypothetical protein [Gemmatimonadota bacterium]